MDLREYYITPEYLERMGNRARQWSENHIKRQLTLFRRTIPDYPEVLEILEGELHMRNLNALHRHARKVPVEKLDELLGKYGEEPDYREIIEAEIAIRGGARKLHDSSGET